MYALETDMSSHTLTLTHTLSPHVVTCYQYCFLQWKLWWCCAPITQPPAARVWPLQRKSCIPHNIIDQTLSACVWMCVFAVCAGMLFPFPLLCAGTRGWSECRQRCCLWNWYHLSWLWKVEEAAAGSRAKHIETQLVFLAGEQWMCASFSEDCTLSLKGRYYFYPLDSVCLKKQFVFEAPNKTYIRLVCCLCEKY